MLRRVALRSLQLRTTPRAAASPLWTASFSTSESHSKNKGHRRSGDVRPSFGNASHPTSKARSPGPTSGSNVAEFPTPPSVEESFQGSTKSDGERSLAEDSFSETQPEFEAGPGSSRNTEAHSSDQRPTSSPGKRDASAIDHTESSDRLQAASPFLSDAQPQQGQAPQPLPDLTKGIPSTLDAELERSQRTSSSSAGLETVEEPAKVSSRGGGGGHDLPKTAYITSQDRRKEKFANWMYSILLGGAIGGIIFSGRNWATAEEEHNHPDAPNGWGLMLFYNRVKARVFDTTSYFNEPAFPKLLPTPDPTWERPYTLVLSLEDLLVSSQWTREHGWRMAKRPGVDYFLRYLSQYYELVIFTSLPSMQGDAIIRKLDPYRIVMWPLFREATRYTEGQYVKVRPPISYTTLIQGSILKLTYPSIRTCRSLIVH